MHPHQDVLERRHMLEEADVLEGPPHAALGDRVRRLAGDVLAEKGNPARRRSVDAGEHVEEGRLPGAVRPDQRDDLATRDDEVDVVDGDEAAELLAELLRDKDVVALTPVLVLVHVPSWVTS